MDLSHVSVEKADYKMSRKGKKAIATVGAVIILLFTVLVVHIVVVTRPDMSGHVALQLGRIDFPDTLDQTQRSAVLLAIRQVEGIDIAKVNAPGTSLIYSFPTGTLSYDEVYKQFASQITFRSQPFVAPPMREAGGCPVMDKTSLAYRFSAFVRNTFH